MRDARMASQERSRASDHGFTEELGTRLLGDRIVGMAKAAAAMHMVEAALNRANGVGRRVGSPATRRQEIAS